MRKLIKHKKGQFIIIAFLMIAMMIISIGALMHGAVTYYKHEPWQEYLTLIGSIELNSRRLVELSLANYTHTQDNNTLRANLQKWQNDLTRMYPGCGIALNYILVNRGLACDWNKTASFSAANATFNLNITSIGLTGYKFTAVAFLNLTILDVNTPTNEITVTVKGEDKTPVTNLEKGNFQVKGLSITSVTSRYHQDHILVYIIKCGENIPTTVTVTVWDQRGIQVTAKHP